MIYSPAELKMKEVDSAYATMGERLRGGFVVEECLVQGAALGCELILTKLPDLHKDKNYFVTRLLNSVNKDRLQNILNGVYGFGVDRMKHGEIRKLDVEHEKIELFWKLIREYGLPVAVAGHVVFNKKDFDWENRLKKPSGEIVNTALVVLCGDTGKTVAAAAMRDIKKVEVSTLDKYSGTKLDEIKGNSIEEILLSRKMQIKEKCHEVGTLGQTMDSLLERFEAWGEYRPEMVLVEGIDSPDDVFGVNVNTLMTMEGFEVQLWIEKDTDLVSLKEQLQGIGVENVALPIVLSIPLLTNENIDAVYQLIMDAVDVIKERYKAVKI